ncbi:hypothetical protein ABG067_003778 [Albugo candida]
MEPVGLEPAITKDEDGMEQLCREFIQKTIQMVITVIHSQDIKSRAFHKVAAEGCAAVLASVSMFELGPNGKQPGSLKSDRDRQQCSRSLLTSATVKLHHNTLSSLEDLFNNNAHELELFWLSSELCRAMKSMDNKLWLWCLHRDQVDSFITAMGKRFGCPVLPSTQRYILRQASAFPIFINLEQFLDLMQQTKLAANVTGDYRYESSKPPSMPLEPAPCEIDGYSSSSSKNSLSKLKINRSDRIASSVSSSGSTTSGKASKSFQASDRADQTTYNSMAQQMLPGKQSHNELQQRKKGDRKSFSPSKTTQRYNISNYGKKLLSSQPYDQDEVSDPDDGVEFGLQDVRPDAIRSEPHFVQAEPTSPTQKKSGEVQNEINSINKQTSSNVHLPKIITKVPLKGYRKIQGDTYRTASEQQNSPTLLRKTKLLFPPVTTPKNGHSR